MPIAGSKPSVNEDSIRYQARTKLADLALDISGSRKLLSPETKKKLKQAKMIRLWLKALDYKEFLSREQREKIWYALIDIADINDFPLAPVLDTRTKPSILSGGTTTVTVVNQSSTDGKITFTNSDVDTGTEVADSFSRSLSTGAKWTAVIRKNDGTARVEFEVSATWLADGSDVEKKVTSTLYSGTGVPGDVLLDVVHNTGNIELRVTVVSDNWTIEGYREHIPGTQGVQTTNNLPTNSVIVGDAQAIATATDTVSLGHILADSVTGLTVKTGVILNVHIAANANITRTKLASGTAYRILANNSSGVMSENAALTGGRLVSSDVNGQLTTGVDASMAGFKITSLGNGVSSTDAINKSQLDAVNTSLSSSITSINSSITSINSSITSINSSITSIGSQITTINSSITTLTGLTPTVGTYTPTYDGNVLEYGV
jgi:hypothetical protein